MNAVVQGVPAGPGLKMAESLLAGRIVAVRAIKTQEGRLFLTLVRLPAPDEYTSPQTVEVRSVERLGDAGADWRGRVRIGGYARQYDVTDKETGERTTVRTAEVRLEAVA